MRTHWELEVSSQRLSRQWKVALELEYAANRNPQTVFNLPPQAGPHIVGLKYTNSSMIIDIDVQTTTRRKTEYRFIVS